MCTVSPLPKYEVRDRNIEIITIIIITYLDVPTYKDFQY